MSKYIEKIKNEYVKVKDEFDEDRVKIAILVTLKRTPEGKCFKLFVDNVELKNERDEKLKQFSKVDKDICYTTRLDFKFDIDSDWSELQLGSIFEITVHRRPSNKQETFKYRLSEDSWEEISEGQL